MRVFVLLALQVSQAAAFSQAAVVVALAFLATAAVEDSPAGRRVVTYDAHYHTSRLEHELADVTDSLLPKTQHGKRTPP